MTHPLSALGSYFEINSAVRGAMASHHIGKKICRVEPHPSATTSGYNKLHRDKDKAECRACAHCHGIM